MNVISILIFVLVVLMIFSEIYKLLIEKSKELNDERGTMILLKTKNLSYSIMFAGIIGSVILVRTFELVQQENFIYLVMIVFLVQSIASSIYLFSLKRV
ncbi:hypothetical protein H9650_20115 [Psychrobacillus sp. Sa2BUA9]|uniref:DUF3784 domain-containing protein n=1 Tax=Psychrobacillus faecigallinarum TaxID=2762235 RepID=A0ABR8RF85_9BACI|nr:hypothetical protein [Psychrobacillus faecigallinarum]MBD7946405.1 hypothetical protein [Psychrobacillus faecigallinarum]